MKFFRRAKAKKEQKDKKSYVVINIEWPDGGLKIRLSKIQFTEVMIFWGTLIGLSAKLLKQLI
jgi:hypothetical protein